MIINAEIISQPYSGEYIERMYDNESVWNSQDWTFVKFTNGDFSEWCGHFRGSPIQVAISLINNIALVLTSDYLYQLDLKTSNLTYLDDQAMYTNLTVAPNGDFIISDYYDIEKISINIHNKVTIESPIKMDKIEFKKWEELKLEFTCYEFLNWGRHLIMTYDLLTNKIEIKE
ncbi:MAG TPA: hypothetical protein VLY87_08085 [Flavobacterium sp.]|nr:hypothetical protein [Flavobacterium sp.]